MSAALHAVPPHAVDDEAGHSAAWQPPATWRDRDQGEVAHCTHVWAYRPSDGGTPLGHVVRYECANGRKMMIPFFKRTATGAWAAGAPAEPRPLFGLDTLDRPGAIFVTEGEKDAAALQALGLCALTSLGGSQSAGRADWEPVRQASAQGRHILIWPDQDAAGQQYAAQVAQQIGPACRCLRRPPSGTPALKGAGAADWLQAQLAGQRIAWDGLAPPGLSDAQRQALQAQLLGALADIQGPLPPEWHARPTTGDRQRHPQAEAIPRTYLITDQGTFRVTRSQGGEPIQQQLANFTAVIQEEVIRDDGQEQTRTLTLAGSLSGRTLPAITLTLDQFTRMDWPARHWGTMTLIHPGQGAKDHLKYAIQLLSHQGEPPVTMRTLFTHTGWRRLAGAWRYLSAGAVIGAQGAVSGIEVDLGELGALYRLPAPSASADERHAAAAASAASAQVAPPEIAIPLIAAVYLAPLSQSLGVDFALWLEGPSRSLKSTLAALMTAHFGAGIDRTRLAASWLDTPNAIGLKLFLLADTLAVIDDYAPQPSASEQARLDKTVATIIRGIGNRAGRGRLTADIRLQNERKPRALALCTAEQWPTGESLQARLFGVALRPGQVDLARLSEIQALAQQGVLARAMADYLQTLAGDFSARVDELKAEWEVWRGLGLQAGLQGRTPDQAAYLLLGYSLALDHWRASGVITSEHSYADLCRAQSIILALAKEHERRIAHAQPADTFMAILTDLLLSGAVHVRDMADHRPSTEAERLGWTREGPGGPHIGWVNAGKQELYLLPTPTLEAVYSASKRIDTPLTLRPAALKRQLLDRGFLQPGNSEQRGDKQVDRTTRKVRIGQHTASVLVVLLQALERPEANREH
ncbi:hypothetical protein HW932_20370 [Allochromatium humboldtianum]|uniref:DUF927 domain-containing protein n=1 Tax=Allochromatium humboldtianum TaxID=504901 RepID=A0A850RE28_9GAMM|nr:hypothetical protein [Allochromatium humboldtianum]NVZ11608.1 hypothetical protein [Allochromatium humboldtianum]